MPTKVTRPVVVAVDGSSIDIRLLDLAAREAAARNTGVLIVHALDGAVDKGAAGRLHACAEAIRERYSWLDADVRLLPGDAVGELVRFIDVPLLVLGHPRRLVRGHGVHADRVAERVVRLASVPVLVDHVLSGDQRPVRPVLVGVGRRRSADPELEFAFTEAALRSAPLLAMRVWSVPSDVTAAQERAGDFDYARAAAVADAELAELLAPWRARFPDVPVEQVARHSLDVPVPLTAASHVAQLVVVGASSLVADALLHRAVCPIAVVPSQRAAEPEPMGALTATGARG